MRILGITNKEPSGLHLCWSASGIAFVTAASVVTVEMAAQSIAAQEDAFMGVFINDEKQFRQKIRAVPGKRKYIIYPPFAFHRRFAYRWIWSGWNKWD